MTPRRLRGDAAGEDEGNGKDDDGGGDRDAAHHGAREGGANAAADRRRRARRERGERGEHAEVQGAGGKVPQGALEHEGHGGDAALGRGARQEDGADDGGVDAFHHLERDGEAAEARWPAAGGAASGGFPDAGRDHGLMAVWRPQKETAAPARKAPAGMSITARRALLGMAASEAAEARCGHRWQLLICGERRS